MVRVFNPYEHGNVDIDIVKKLDISMTDQIFNIVNEVRAFLRDDYSQSFAQSVIDSCARERMKTIITEYITPRKHLRIQGMPFEKMIETIHQEILYYGPIQKALTDKSITNIDINSPQDVFIERDGEEEYSPEFGFKDDEHLYNIINKMLIPLGKTLTANEPHIDSIFENFRICAVLHAEKGGVATESTVVSIRKFAEDTITPEQLVEFGTISKEINDFFQAVIPVSNIIIAGATNSGKTTTLISFPLYFSENTRIITIEDSPEMMLRRKKAYRDYRNIVPLQTKYHENPEKRYDIAKLTKVSLRMRPWKIIIGEVRDSNAARQAHEAMNTGHNCYLTLHASSAQNAATRLVQLAGDGYNDEAIAAQLADTVDLIIFQQKIKKSRIITEIVELIGYEGAKHPLCNTIFKYVHTGISESGCSIGYHQMISPISAELANKLRIGLVPEKDIQRWSFLPKLEDNLK